VAKNLTPPWKPGESGNPNGRPVGNRNRLNERFIKALHDDFCEHGAKVIAEVREDKPDVYLKVIASILPRELHFKNETAFEGMNDDQLDEVIGAIRRTLTARTPASSGAGAPKAGGGNKLN
jgi:hypothetical protein